MMLVDVVKKYVGVRETGANCGVDVEKFQKAVDGKAQGESWCMAFVQFCIKEVEEATKVTSKIFRSEHCLTVWNKSPLDMRRLKPAPGYVVIWQHAGTSNGHTGVVVEVVNEETFKTVEGNTSDAQIVERNGDGVYFKTRKVHPTGTMKVVGFLAPFGD